jgi:hypothetical protein
VQLDLAHLEGRGVAVAQEVADKTAVLLHFLGPLAVRDPGRLHDGFVGAHIIDDAHEAVVEHLEGFAGCDRVLDARRSIARPGGFDIVRFGSIKPQRSGSKQGELGARRALTRRVNRDHFLPPRHARQPGTS